MGPDRRIQLSGSGTGRKWGALQAAHGGRPAPFSPMLMERGIDPVEMLKVFSKGAERAEEMGVSRGLSKLLSSKLPLDGITRKAKGPSLPSGLKIFVVG